TRFCMVQTKAVLKARRTAVTATLAAAVILAIGVAAPVAQNQPVAPRIAPAEGQFGHAIGDDYYLVNYTQYVDYLRKLDLQSERMIVAEIGKTEEGRAELTAIITSPENHRRLPLIKEANRRLALADGLTDDQARALARDGKIVVWIDGGLHATEVLGAQQLIETIYRLNTKSDPETLRILNDVVILCTLVNPDGMELVSNWYMREAEGKPGAVMRTGAPYSTWFNGGIRTTSYFHNQIGILTETIGNPTPVEIPFVLDMQLPRADVPNPIQPRTFYFREAIEYSVTNNYAILDVASKRHEDFLFNMYKMAKNAIDKGNRDSWTIHPKRIEAAR